MGERQKAKYRILVFGLTAILGPAVFGLQVGGLVIMYAVLLVAYSLWAIRLTVVFPNDSSLGCLLCLLDAALVMPLLAWGTSLWLFVPLVILWLAGLVVTIRGARRAAPAASAEEPGAEPMVELPQCDSTGYMSRAAFVSDLRMLYKERVGNFALLVVRLQRYQEAKVLMGAESAGQVLGAMSRRVQREAGGELKGYHITDDRVAFILSGNTLETAGPVAVRARKAANSRLINGRKMEAVVGYAAYPVDGLTPRDLLLAADRRASESAAGAAASALTRPAATIAGSRIAAL